MSSLGGGGGRSDGGGGGLLISGGGGGKESSEGGPGMLNALLKVVIIATKDRLYCSRCARSKSHQDAPHQCRKVGRCRTSALRTVFSRSPGAQLGYSTTMAATSNHIKLAQGLPPRLLRFFARFPPPQPFIDRALQNNQMSGGSTLSSAPLTSTADSNECSLDAPPPPPSTDPSATPYPNPFLSTKHHVTGRWHNPIFSLRRQADLVKLAKQHGLEDLLPYTPKKTEEKLKKRITLGLRVKGTGVGQKVKGHIEERTLRSRLDKRRQAMIQMPALVQQWKQVCESFLGSSVVVLTILAWTWSWMEEMAEMMGDHLEPSLVYLRSR